MSNKKAILAAMLGMGALSQRAEAFQVFQQEYSTTWSIKHVTNNSQNSIGCLPSKRKKPKQMRSKRTRRKNRRGLLARKKFHRRLAA